MRCPGKKKKRGGRSPNDTYRKKEKEEAEEGEQQQQQQLARVQTAGISTHFTCLPYRDTGQLTHVYNES